MRINGKLWLAFFCTLSFCVFAMYWLMHSTLKRGFLDYTSEEAVQRLNILRDAVISIHDKQNSFDELAKDPQRWLELKSIVFSESKPEASDSPDESERAPSPRSYYREFVNSISLFDAEKNLLLGVIKAGRTISWMPIERGDSITGYLGFVKPDVVVREADRRFMTQQLTLLGMISLVILLLSVGVATLLARRISGPIKALSHQTEALASGDYRRRMPVRTRDEIGQLCENFNKLAQALEAHEQSRANWIADISHEMRTPVSVLKAQIEAMQDNVRPLDQKGLALLHQKVSGLSRLIDDLFELTLSDVGALSYHKSALSLDQLTTLCVEQYMTKAEDAGLMLSLYITDDRPVTIHGDPARLEQLLSNLLENAIRYTDAGGKIEVELQKHAESVILLIRDSAPTVAPALRDVIFERLHRLESSRSRNTGGAGLGLAIARNIVLAHQGTIQAEDSPLGGLTIRVELPQPLG